MSTDRCLGLIGPELVHVLDQFASDIVPGARDMAGANVRRTALDVGGGKAAPIDRGHSHHTVLSTNAVGVRAAARPGSKATTLTRIRVTTPTSTRESPGTVGSGTA